MQFKIKYVFYDYSKYDKKFGVGILITLQLINLFIIYYLFIITCHKIEDAYFQLSFERLF